MCVLRACLQLGQRVVAQLQRSVIEYVPLASQAREHVRRQRGEGGGGGRRDVVAPMLPTERGSEVAYCVQTVIFMVCHASLVASSRELVVRTQTYTQTNNPVIVRT